jgi:hypothetical protein
MENEEDPTVKKRTRGRPATGSTPLFPIRISLDLKKRIEWAMLDAGETNMTKWILQAITEKLDRLSKPK